MIIPSIDLIKGCAVQLVGGKEEDLKVMNYGNNTNNNNNNTNNNNNNNKNNLNDN